MVTHANCIGQQWDIVYHINEALIGFGGTGEQGHLFQGYKGTGLKMSGTWVQSRFGGTGNKGNQDFDFWGRERSDLFEGN